MQFKDLILKSYPSLKQMATQSQLVIDAYWNEILAIARNPTVSTFEIERKIYFYRTQIETQTKNLSLIVRVMALKESCRDNEVLPGVSTQAFEDEILRLQKAEERKDLKKTLAQKDKTIAGLARLLLAHEETSLLEELKSTGVKNG